MTEEFYRAFEDRHRGPREVIKKRFEAYLPFLDGLMRVSPQLRALDLGCGRGEWLELLGEHAVEAEGVDLDAGMLRACQEIGLHVTQMDALEYLKAQPAKSYDVISAHHLVEHIPFPSLRELVEHALRVLRPGGLLIMETPNPENLIVGASNFYLDPTHTQPIPAPLLTFLTEFYGFSRQKVMGLQEPDGIRQSHTATLSNVLNDVSPDYAVVAQAPGTGEQLAALDEPFAAACGCTLAALVQRFDQGVENALTAIEDRLEQSERFNEGIESALTCIKDQQGQAEQFNQGVESALARIEDQLGQTERFGRGIEGTLGGIENRLEQVERFNEGIEIALARIEDRLGRAERFESELQAVYASNSWRITSPLRMTAQLARSVFLLPRKIASRLKVTVKILLRPLVVTAMRAILRRPGIRRRVNAQLYRHPGLRQRLVRVAQNAGLIPGGAAPSVLGTQYDPSRRFSGEQGAGVELNQLPESARRIYWELKDAIERREKIK